MSFLECEKCGGIPGVTACCQSNTPESSAAQGAVTREALLHLICDYTGNRINLPNFTIEELEDFAHAVLSFGWKPADDAVLLCVACSEPTGAQPSDATAQPSDEQIKQALYKELDCEGGWPLYEVTTGNVISVVRALLANTAQGKPEHQECSGDPSSCPENEGFGCCGKRG